MKMRRRLIFSVYTEGRDLESEAEAFSMMGKIFLNFEKPQKGAGLFPSEHQSCHGFMAESHGWFKTAKKFLEEIQVEIKKEEDEKLKQERDKLAEKYADELKDLESVGVFIRKTSLKPFLEKIRQDIKSGEISDCQKGKKSLLLKVIKEYHPDKGSEVVDLKRSFSMEKSSGF